MPRDWLIELGHSRLKLAALGGGGWPGASETLMPPEFGSWLERGIAQSPDRFWLAAVPGADAVRPVTAALEDSEAKPVQRTSMEKEDDLKDALGHGAFEQTLQRRAEQRRDKIVEQRTEMRAELEKSGSGSWLSGIDDVEIASKDLLTVTVYYGSN